MPARAVMMQLWAPETAGPWSAVSCRIISRNCHRTMSSFDKLCVDMIQLFAEDSRGGRLARVRRELAAEPEEGDDAADAEAVLEDLRDLDPRVHELL